MCDTFPHLFRGGQQAVVDAAAAGPHIGAVLILLGGAVGREARLQRKIVSGERRQPAFLPRALRRQLRHVVAQALVHAPLACGRHMEASLPGLVQRSAA